MTPTTRDAKARALVAFVDDYGRLRTGQLVFWPVPGCRKGRRARVRLRSGTVLSVDTDRVALTGCKAAS